MTSKAARDRIDMLYRKFGTTTYQRALRRLGDRDAALDLTQEVFQRLLGVADRLEDSERTHRYLFRTTTNAINRHLGQRRRLQALHEQFASQRPVADQDSDDGLARRLARHDLDAIAPMLSEDEWELLFYRYFEEMKTTEIADVLSISDRGVRKRFQRLHDKIEQLQAAL